MAQIFRPSFNTIARVSIFGAAFGALGAIGLAYGLMKSQHQTRVSFVIEQPVAFSHAHHSGELGIDCRYCHTSVEWNKYATVPPTHTCMSCHSQIWDDSPMLKPVRDSLANNQPLEWQKIHDLPGFVYFNHGIHVQKGVGCVSCHGRVDQMKLTYKAEPMTMEWCLNCHRNPEKYLRPVEEVFNAEYALSTEDQLKKGLELKTKYNIHSAYYLTNCTVCHR